MRVQKYIKAFSVMAGTVVLACAVGCTAIEEHNHKRVTEYSPIDLPLMHITTSSGKGISSKDRWEDAVLSIEDAKGRTILGHAEIRVKGRGNSTWNMPKKPFNIDFGENVAVLGMGAAPKWCMLANYKDPSAMRNDISLKMASMTSLEWTPQGRFVELMLDGEFQGNYYLAEKVDFEEGHVDVGLSGALVCLDSYYDGEYKFRTALRGLPVNVEMPSGCALDAAGLARIKNRMDELERAICKGEGELSEIMDIQSFCDWFIVHELTENNEPTRPHSVYMHWRSDGQVVAGPCWDFDCRTFRTGVKGFTNASALWFGDLLAREEFISELKGRWTALKPLFRDGIPEYINGLDASIARSVKADREIWPISSLLFSKDECLPYDDAVKGILDAFDERMESLDRLIDAL